MTFSSPRLRGLIYGFLLLPSTFLLYSFLSRGRPPEFAGQDGHYSNLGARIADHDSSNVSRDVSRSLLANQITI